MTKNVSKPRQCRRRGVSMRRARAGPGPGRNCRQPRGSAGAGAGAGSLPLRGPPAGGGSGQGSVAPGVRTSFCRPVSGAEPGAAGEGPPIRLRPRSPGGGRAGGRAERMSCSSQQPRTVVREGSGAAARFFPRLPRRGGKGLSPRAPCAGAAVVAWAARSGEGGGRLRAAAALPSSPKSRPEAQPG